MKFWSLVGHGVWPTIDVWPHLLSTCVFFAMDDTGASRTAATSGGAANEKGRKRKKESEGASGESKMIVRGVYSVSQLIDA